MPDSHEQSPLETRSIVGGFAIVPPAPNLWIPCWIDGSTAPAEEILRCKPAGTLLSPGNALLENHPALHDMPLSPAAGKIVELSSALILHAQRLPAVRVETVGLEQPASNEFTEASPIMPGEVSARIRRTPLADWIDQFRQSASWLWRWTCPDLITQLRRSLTSSIETVICSLLDLDPAMPVQSMIASAWANDLVIGVSGLSSLTGASRAWIVIPDNLDRACYARLTQAITGTSIQLVPINNRYPLAHPSLLVQTLINRKLGVEKSPVEQGILLLDASNALNAGRVFARGAKTTLIPLGIFDQRTRRSHYAMVPIGTPVSYLLKSLGIDSTGAVISTGTPLLERPHDVDGVVTGLSYTLYVAPIARELKTEPCIRCGWCIEACPVHIQPPGLLEAAQVNDLSLANEYGLSACIECGICTYVCPSRLPVLNSIRILRRSASVS